MRLSYQQQVAFDEAMHFIFNTKKVGFVFSGVAGSGKSTVINKITTDLKRINYNYTVLAPTGRAASVLRAKGVSEASTIHSWLYEPILDNNGNLIEFKPRLKSVLASEVDVIIVDEAGMINEEIFQDLIEIGVPILFVGDSEQLPPVSEIGFNVMSQPDVHLTEVHRQAEGNPIIELSRHVRETGNWDYSLAGDVIKFVRESELNADYLSKNHYDMILCGTNSRRCSFNRLMRFVQGHFTETPEVGEVVMCLRNQHFLDSPSIYNGELYKISEKQLPLRKNEEKIRHYYSLVNLDTKKRTSFLRIRNDSWDEIPPPRNSDNPDSYFTYGYAATVHKSQGSAFGEVLFVDEDVTHFLDRRRFRYTAVTRAVNRVVIAQ